MCTLRSKCEHGIQLRQAHYIDYAYTVHSNGMMCYTILRQYTMILRAVVPVTSGVIHYTATNLDPDTQMSSTAPRGMYKTAQNNYVSGKKLHVWPYYSSFPVPT